PRRRAVRRSCRLRRVRSTPPRESLLWLGRLLTWRLSRVTLQARGLAVHEDAGLIDALRFQHVAAHRGLDQHREVAAWRVRNRDLRDLHFQHFMYAYVAREAHHRVLGFVAGRAQV